MATESTLDDATGGPTPRTRSQLENGLMGIHDKWARCWSEVAGGGASRMATGSTLDVAVEDPTSR